MGQFSIDVIFLNHFSNQRKNYWFEFYFVVQMHHYVFLMCLKIVAYLSNGDELIAEQWLGDVTPTSSQLHDAVRRATIRRTFIPVFVGTALKNKGVQSMIDAVVRYLPNPSEVVNRASTLNKV